MKKLLSASSAVAASSERGLALSLAAQNEKKWVTFIEEYQGGKVTWHDIDELTPSTNDPLLPPMITLCIAGGKKDKLRPGDLLGALTGDAGIAGTHVGKISVFESFTYVALHRSIAEAAFRKLSHSKIKGRSFKMRFVGEDL